MAAAGEDAHAQADRAAASHLSCQAIVAANDVTVEIPHYTLDRVKENG